MVSSTILTWFVFRKYNWLTMITFFLVFFGFRRRYTHYPLRFWLKLLSTYALCHCEICVLVVKCYYLLEVRLSKWFLTFWRPLRSHRPRTGAGRIIIGTIIYYYVVYLNLSPIFKNIIYRYVAPWIGMITLSVFLNPHKYILIYANTKGNTDNTVTVTTKLWRKLTIDWYWIW